jgi:phosphoribosylanthranilate isomerase
MTDIKICGMTNPEDALHAAECGAHAVGFIFYPKSPRYVAPETARSIIRRLPSGISKVGVFVNEDPDEVMAVAAFCGLDFIQLHGNETPEYCRQISGFDAIKAFSPRTGDDIPEAGEYEVRAVLVDAYAPGVYGGTGKTSDWEFAVRLKEHYPLILSGGLHSGNIVEALKKVFPCAVDINSGVEISPGRKDSGKVREIIEIVRKTDGAANKVSAGPLFRKVTKIS